MLRGAAASPGIGAGRAVVIEYHEPDMKKQIAVDTAQEQSRFLKAVGEFCTMSLINYHNVRERLGESEAAIISAQIVIVTDAEFHKEVFHHIREEGVTAEYAVFAVCDKYIAMFAAMDNELLCSRAADFKDIRHQLLNILSGRRQQTLCDVPKGSVLTCVDIFPSLAVTMEPGRICAAVTQQGSCLSHLAIVAKALGIPVVTAVDTLLEQVKAGDWLVVDGDHGVVMNNPTVSNRRYWRASRTRWRVHPMNSTPRLTYNQMKS